MAHNSRGRHAFANVTGYRGGEQNVVEMRRSGQKSLGQSQEQPSPATFDLPRVGPSAVSLFRDSVIGSQRGAAEGGWETGRHPSSDRPTRPTELTLYSCRHPWLHSSQQSGGLAGMLTMQGRNVGGPRRAGMGFVLCSLACFALTFAGKKVKYLYSRVFLSWWCLCRGGACRGCQGSPVGRVRGSRLQDPSHSLVTVCHGLD